VFDVGPLEILVLLIVGLLVFGPDRLPEMARQAGSWLRDLRRMVANARRDLSDGLGVDEADLRKLQNINPKSYVRRNVLDGLDLDLGLDDDDKPPRRSGGRTTGSGGERVTKAAVDPPYDPDAT
jgi:sec-independent protein translocase protein TatB